MNIHDRRILLVLDCAQFAAMFPDLKAYATERARWFMKLSARELYEMWCFMEEANLLPDAACYAALAAMRQEVTT